jgi:2-dehydropantoate 2-reductase
VITGAHRTQLNRTDVTVHQDDILVGGSCEDAPIEPAESLAGHLRAGGVPTRATNQISKFLWEKLLYNVCVNAPGALFNRSLGELMDDPETRLLLESLLEEAWCAMVCAGQATRFATFGEYRQHFEVNLVPRTRDHKSSMFQDLQREHPKTEIDFLNGAICRIARANGWIAGLNQWLTNRIHRLETSLNSCSSALSLPEQVVFEKGVQL